MSAVRLFGRDERLAKGFRQGTHRSCPPAATLARFRPLGPAIGLTRLANVTGLDTIGLPVWVAIRPNARGLTTSQGKGLSHDAAKASALMESIETWHAETIDRPVRIDSPWAMARRAPTVAIEGLSFYEDSPPRADLPLPWIEGCDLITGEPCWTPLETVSTSYVVSAQLRQAASFVQSSNGLAGGNHVLEAVVHALCELIERDAVHAGAEALRRLDPSLRVANDSVDDADCRAVIKLLEAAGLLVAIFDLTHDLDVPTYAATILDADATLRWRTLPPFNGYGTHPTPGVALLRALTEAAQSRLTHISGSRDDISAAEYARGGNPDDLASVRARLAASPGRLFRERRDQATESFEGDVAMLLARLRAGGIDQIVAIDLGRPEIGAPVVKLVVPGLAAPTPLIRGRAIRTPSRLAPPAKALAA